MKTKFTPALTAAIGACLLTVASVSHAESQSGWQQRQLEITDGYAPPFKPAEARPAPAGDTATRVPAASANPQTRTPEYPERKASGSIAVPY
jgi:hypothetical protein